MVNKIRDIIKAVEAVKNASPLSDDVNSSFIKSLKVGSPVIVHDPGGEPSFWLVPLLKGKYAIGFAHVNLSVKVIRMGLFGSNPKDRSAWIDISFFKQPTPVMLNEIDTKFSGSAISKPLFSFDTNQSRWAWLLKIKNKDNHEILAFITPGGWYEEPTDILNRSLEK